jgi:exonuclease SbcC
MAMALVVGDPCPVCLRPVEELVEQAAPAALAAQEEALNEVSRALEQARKRHAGSVNARVKAESAITTVEERRDQLKARVAAHPDPQALEILIAQVKRVHGEVATARKQASTTRNQLEGARNAVDALIRQEKEAGASFDRQRDPLVPLGPPTPGRSSLAEDWQALAIWAAAEEPTQQQLARKTTEEAERLRAEQQTAVTNLAQACRTHGVVLEQQAPITAATLHTAVVEAEAQAGADLRSIQERIDEAHRTRVSLQETRGQAEVARLLAQLLSASGFERWLVSEALDLLVQGASATLLRLSGDQYSLTCDHDGSFLVIDHRNADEKRSARTLSGGETFQASLALALALADQLAQLAAGGAAKLEAIFLDEGFGALDETTLNTVADTIETLGTGDRMVGIVTHVRELADRVPVRYQVAKDARTSTVERVLV